METTRSGSGPDFQSLFQSAPGLYLVLTPDLTIVAASDAYLHATMTRREAILGRGIFEVFPDNPQDPTATGTRNLRASLERVLARRVRDTMAVQKYDIRKPESEGGGFEERYWSPTNTPVLGPGNEVIYIIHCVEDVTELTRLKRQGIEQQELKDELKTDERFDKAFNASPEPITIVRLRDARIIEVNQAFLRVTGFRREEVIGRTAIEMKFWTVEQLNDFVGKLKRNESLRNIEIPFQAKSGERRIGLHSAEIIEVAGMRCSLNLMKDITEQRALEQQLRQAQKMEAIGKLSGGIAHDFNNLLSVIIGYSEALTECLSNDPALHKKAQEISKAGRRAADLTRQLLAFSRQQILEPRVMNLNVVVSDLQTMLHRLIGENIELSVSLDPALTQVRADPGQISQVILNLVVNARDAMPDGGRIRIETANAEFDQAYARQHPPAQPGPYVLLSVTDTGTGMSAETQARIFEPFFTTKEVGRGTGLGLATVYGIVKQCGGYIWVYSELGHGTTFKIYLPQVGSSVPPQEETSRPAATARGSETILLVEDEDALRELIRATLSENGYTVLEADKPSSAVELCRHHSGRVHLLLTDVVMPGLSGPELADHLLPQRTGMKVLFISGYPGDSIVRQRLLAENARILQKPFTRAALLQSIREVLESDKAPVKT